MICYTLSDCVLNKADSAILCNLLFVFPNTSNPHKLVIDSTKKIIDIYLSYDDHAIQLWLEQMGIEKKGIEKPLKWELVDVDNIEQATTNEEVFLMVCSQTEDKMLIVYNHNGWTKGKYYHKRNILHQKTPIRVLDREEAIELLALTEEDVVKRKAIYEKDLQPPPIINNVTNITNSVVAQNGSSISDVKNKK
jgi:hypothetical protein